MVLTPYSLAQRWGCSAETVRQMYRDGELPGFVVGRKLIRFTLAAVENHERKQMELYTGEQQEPEPLNLPRTRAADAIMIMHTRKRRTRPLSLAKTKVNSKPEQSSER